MVLHQPQIWQLLLLLWLLQTDFCASQRLVQTQKGPLYRVKGFSLSICCNVSGLTNLITQDFAFSIYHSTRMDPIQIISTNDRNFAYAIYSKRVREGNIVIKRLSDMSVIFHIESLKEEDTGRYECYTPNTDGRYFGTYSMETTVNVIEDTLVVSYFGPAAHSISEGEFLQLECQIFSHTFQHTHLSVTWYLRDSNDTRPIISLDRDLTIKPGPEFEHRYRSGHITMEKIEDTTYRLKITQIQQSDSGELYCQAEEWVQDPDSSWYRICHRTAKGSNIEVKALDTLQKEESFFTQIRVLNEALVEGDTMEVHCSIEAQKVPGNFFAMTWLRNNMIVAQVDYNGVQTIADTYVKREKDGELRTVRKRDRNFVLTLQPVQLKDQGAYQCSGENVEIEAGSFIRGKKQLSPEAYVQIKTKESGLAVVMTKQLVNVTEGEALQISCSISGAKGLLSVSWQHKKSSSSSFFSNVITLSHEGVMESVGPQYQHRDLRTFRSNVADFILEFNEALLSDSGEYMCIVSEWSMESNGNMKKVNSQSKQGWVSVKSIDSLVNVVLKSRTVQVTENLSVKMICSVKAPKISLAVTWKFEPQNSTTQKHIMCIDHTGSMSCGAEQQEYQMETQVQESGTDYILKVLRASNQQVGKYQCQVDAYDKNVQKTRKMSNPLAITVRRPASQLSVSTTHKSPLKIQANSNTGINCLVISSTSNLTRFEVTWKHGTASLLRMGPEGVVTQEIDERISMKRTDRKTFQLMIHQVKPTDSGLYHCLVQEWIQDPNKNWYNLDTKSVTIEIDVFEEESDFSMDKTNARLDATEGEQVKVNCSLKPGGLKQTFLYSLSWFYQSQDQSTVKLLTYSHDGRLQFQVSDSDLRRLYFSRPIINVFYLSILNSIPSDSGSYYCEVDQYQSDCKGKWERKASDRSGFTNVMVNFIESKLQVQKSRRSLNVTYIQSGFMLECEIISRSSETSVFEVTWFRRQKDERPLTIFTTSRDGTLRSSIPDRTLLYDRPSTTLYTLTVPKVDSSDNGQYQCQVIEWLRTGVNTWRKVAEDKSGELFINVEVELKPTEGDFTLHTFATHQNATEGEQMDISCFITVDQVDPNFYYSLTWFVERQDSSASTFLLSHTHYGLLQYQSEKQQLSNRLQFSRPTAKRFQLRIFDLDPSDSGNYQCRVERYQLSCEGNWEKRGSAKLTSTIVNVHKIESKLQVHKSRSFLNVTDIQTGFMVECKITSHSSKKSVFEVTWSRRQKDEQPFTIFSASRDGTLRSTIPDRILVYDRPSTTHYTLTVPYVDSSDNGQYQCQVIEWLQTAANNWRKVAEDKSGELSVTIHVHAKELLYEQTCSSGITLGILIPLLCVLLLVIILLIIQLKKIKTASKKQDNCLWAESMPFNAVTETGANTAEK